MKYCHKCGQQLPDEALFCSKCGTKQYVLTAEETPKQEPVEEDVLEEVIEEKPEEMVAEPVVEEVETIEEEPVQEPEPDAIAEEPVPESEPDVEEEPLTEKVEPEPVLEEPKVIEEKPAEPAEEPKQEENKQGNKFLDFIIFKNQIRNSIIFFAALFVISLLFWILTGVNVYVFPIFRFIVPVMLSFLFFARSGALFAIEIIKNRFKNVFTIVAYGVFVTAFFFFLILNFIYWVAY